ncbi:MAG: hypothetical protein V4463_02645 [Pseudomonadota bacterium]
MHKSLTLLASLLALSVAHAGIPQFTPRWQLEHDAIRWQVRDAHSDQLEMSGRQVSAVIDYGSDANGALLLKRTVVWPMLRTIPDDTHASLLRTFGADIAPRLEIDGVAAPSEALASVRFDGQLTLTGNLGAGLTLTHTLSPSTDAPVLLERLLLTNTSKSAVRYRFAEVKHSETTAPGTHGAYVVTAAAPEKSGTLGPGERTSVDLLITGRLEKDMVYVEPGEELERRARKVQGWRGKLVLETPEPALDAMFAFSKIRAAESIFATRGGLLHGPGGTRYYAAIWANDQAEYANPFFPYLGDASAIASALNSFRLFAGFMNDAYKPIPSSIIAEGRGYWNGAGDRGDCAMIAYGASQFALAQGDAVVAVTLRPLIDWCLEYNRRQRGVDGIVRSDSDELEGRFPAGKANLSTNVLAYGALLGAARLATDGAALRAEAQAQAMAIERYFAAKVGGFDTYRYYEGNDKLRAWIALPLAFGLEQRRAGTVAALLSPQLWSENGVLTEAGDSTFWDRATLYAFRGLMKMGELDTVLPYFRYYSQRRLLGEHVPYAVEAWPEGQQRHLSAESALYARVVVEGLFGIEPLGLRRFALAPRLPRGWPQMALKNIRAFGAGEGDGDGITIRTRRQGKGQYVQVSLHGKSILAQQWDGKAPLEVNLP